MKLSRFLPIAALSCVAVLLGGCFAVHPNQPKADRAQTYFRVTTADFEGKRIAEFVSEGPVKQTDEGFTFWAVQRRIFEPSMLEFHYPLGRQVTVAASNTVSVPTCKPHWLQCLDGDYPPEECKPTPTPACRKKR